MSKPWILIDVHYLCYRALYSMVGLSHEDVPTGVLYGVFRDIISLRERFKSNRFVFCFDLGIPFRKNQHRTYKGSREARRALFTDEEKASYKALAEQVFRLRTELLGELGYRNIFFQNGIEADDIIARISLNLSDDDEAVIVSGDADFYQLLRHNVKVFHPAKELLVDKKLFRFIWGVKPKEWILVKCIAGCATDDIPGVPGVKEKTAVKYLLNQLPKSGKIYKRIKTALEFDLVEYNRPLVELPYIATGNDFLLQKNKVTPESWEAVMKKLGMRSLRRSF